MAHITIGDLESSQELDRKAINEIRGGWSLFGFTRDLEISTGKYPYNHRYYGYNRTPTLFYIPPPALRRIDVNFKRW